MSLLRGEAVLCAFKGNEGNSVTLRTIAGRHARRWAHAEPRSSLAWAISAASYAEEGAFELAHNDFEKAIENGSSDISSFTSAALLCLEGGDSEKYSNICRSAIETFRSSTDPHVVDELVWMCCLSPKCSVSASSIMPRIEALCLQHPDSGLHAATKILALFRFGSARDALLWNTHREGKWGDEHELFSRAAVELSRWNLSTAGDEREKDEIRMELYRLLSPMTGSWTSKREVPEWQQRITNDLILQEVTATVGKLEEPIGRKVGDVLVEDTPFAPNSPAPADSLPLADSPPPADPQDDPDVLMIKERREAMLQFFQSGRQMGDNGEYPGAIGQFQKAIAILDLMIENEQEAHSSAKDKAAIVTHVKYCEAAEIATGDWEKILTRDDSELSYLLGIRSRELAKRGRLDDVAKCGAKLEELQPRTRVSLYNAACSYSLCAGMIARRRLPSRNPDVSDIDKNEHSRFLELASKCLTEAIAAGWDDLEFARQDENLSELRKLPVVQSLIAAPADVPAPAPPSPVP